VPDWYAVGSSGVRAKTDMWCEQFRRIHEAKMREEGARWKRERLEGMVEGARRVLGRESSLWRS
jgi:hypothetical protein